MIERIKCAAILLRNREIVEGDSHRKITDLIKQGNGSEPVDGLDGFMTTSGRFVTRYTAATIAIAAGQVEEILDRGVNRFCVLDSGSAASD
jgi:hypothetical protein